MQRRLALLRFSEDASEKGLATQQAKTVGLREGEGAPEVQRLSEALSSDKKSIDEALGKKCPEVGEGDSFSSCAVGPKRNVRASAVCVASQQLAVDEFGRVRGCGGDLAPKSQLATEGSKWVPLFDRE